MIIDLKNISEEIRDFDFSLDEDWWQTSGKRERDYVSGLDMPMNVRGHIYKAGDKYILNGRMDGGLQIKCDRCLEPFHYDVKSDFQLYLTLPILNSDKSDVELQDDDMDVDFIRGDVLDLDEIIREQVYLSLPMKGLCRENCSGLCPSCGRNLNKERCQCRQEQGHPGFATLKNFKVKGEKS